MNRIASISSSLARAFTRKSLSVVLLFLAALGIGLRLMPLLTDFETYDMRYCLMIWTEYIHDHGIAAYGTTFNNYAPLYTYILGLISLLPQPWWMLAIKAVSITGDIAMAYAGAAVVYRASDNLPHTFRFNLGCATAAMVLWLPSVWLNSAAWGQCDVLWTTCCILSLLCLMCGRSLAGVIWYGVAVSFKFQAMFFFPVVFMLLIARKVKWWQVFTIPAVYLATCVPCAMAGRWWTSLIGIYIVQQPADQIRWYYYSASPFYFLRNCEFNRSLAMALLIPVAIFAIWLCIRIARRYINMDTRAQIRLLLVFAAFCGVFFPYVLPMMHERYMYLGDVATLLCAVGLGVNGRMWLAAALTQCASSLTCTAVLRIFPIDFQHSLQWGLVCSTIAVALIGLEMVNLLRKRQ